MTNAQLNRKAINLLRKLNRLQLEANELVEDIDNYASGDDYNYYFRNLKFTLEELSNFDLEDSIDAERYIRG